ncbi:MAG: hypothetical protein HOQ07_03490 [Sinomonas sp.]|nr:hypothetical protein [Sinomonas sp.]
MKSSGAMVTQLFGDDGVSYLSSCEAHRDSGRVFTDKLRAREYAQEHNDAQHHGQAPRFHTFDAERAFRPSDDAVVHGTAQSSDTGSTPLNE